MLAYRDLYPNKVPEFLDNDDWLFISEDEAILRISKENIVLSQNEIKLNADFGVFYRRYAHEKITGDNLSIIDMDNWDGNKNIAQRKVINVNYMSINGINYSKRAILKLEQHLFQYEVKGVFIKTSTANIPEMKLYKREKVYLVLDKITVGREIILTR